MRRQKIIVMLLGLALAILGLLTAAQAKRIDGYAGELNGYRNELDAMYKRAWWEGVERMSALEIEIEKLIISDSPEAASLRLANISRQADGIVQNMGSLPVERDGLNTVMKFINQISAYGTALNEGITQGRPISDDDIGQLQTIQARLSELGSIVYDLDALDNWAGQSIMDIDVGAIAKDNLDYPTLIYDGPFSDGAQGGFKGLGSARVNEAEAMRIAESFAGGQAKITGRAERPLAGYEIACLTDMGEIALFVSEMGGRVIYMLPSHDMVLKEVNGGAGMGDMDSAINTALAYLAGHGFEAMAANYTQRNEGAIMINCAPVKDGVTLYPDLVKVQVSDGRVVGLEAGNYWRNHTERILPKPLITYKQAMEAVNDRLTILSARMALIPSLHKGALSEGEKLCYEFTCLLGKNRYLVYIDALSGMEASILRMFDNGAI